MQLAEVAFQNGKFSGVRKWLQQSLHQSLEGGYHPWRLFKESFVAEALRAEALKDYSTALHLLMPGGEGISAIPHRTRRGVAEHGRALLPVADCDRGAVFQAAHAKKWDLWKSLQQDIVYKYRADWEIRNAPQKTT